MSGLALAAIVVSLATLALTVWTTWLGAIWRDYDGHAYAVDRGLLRISDRLGIDRPRR